MIKQSILNLAVVATTCGLWAGIAQAQYPIIPQEQQQASDAKQKEANAQSDTAFEKALVIIKQEEAAGRPYRPWASKVGDLPQAAIPAFPGAEGGGMYTAGGRGGKVYVVTSLEDSGPGTLREACDAGGARIVVFNVSGIIQLKNRIRIRAPYLTIVGNTAPGDGVCIAGATFGIDTHDVIIRHLRFRRGQTDVTIRDDALGGNPVGNIIIDHCSTSWGLDENMSLYRHMYSPPDGSKDLKLPTVNITIQNSIFSEGLNTFHHAFGSTIGGVNSTFHHNLWACNTGRNPSVGMGGDFTFANNVLFNWVHRTVDGGDDTSRYNIINNYLKPGPATNLNNDVSHRLLKPESTRSKTIIDNFGKAYVNGNIVEGNERVTKDNWDGGVQPEPQKATVADVLAKVRVSEPFPHATITVSSAQDAYEQVLAKSGATLPKRDAVDERVMNMVRTGQVSTTKQSNLEQLLEQKPFTQEHIKELIRLVDRGIITHPEQVGGYPQYKGEPYKDSDSDGMPDEWETKHGLNPNDAADASKDLNGDGYTNIEKFIYGLDPAQKIDWKDLKNNLDPLSK